VDHVHGRSRRATRQARCRHGRQPATPADYYPAPLFDWGATKTLVQNSVEREERLIDSPFTVRELPGLVATYRYLRALGATGPSGD